MLRINANLYGAMNLIIRVYQIPKNGDMTLAVMAGAIMNYNIIPIRNPKMRVLKMAIS